MAHFEESHFYFAKRSKFVSYDKLLQKFEQTKDIALCQVLN